MKKYNILFLLLLPMLLSSMRVRGEDVSIALNMPDTDMTVGDVALVPLNVTNSFAVADVLSYTLQFKYDKNYLRVESVDVEGTIAAAFGPPAVKYEEGLVTISAAGAQPLSGTGVFLKLKIRALNTGWHRLEIANVKMNLWNEGLPLMSYSFGYLRIGSPPSFGIWSNSNLIAKGEKLQYHAGSNATPILWTVGNPALASIDTLGCLTALAPGKTIVVATDTNGVRSVSSELEIRPARISAPEGLIQWPGDTIDVPLWISDLRGLDILSGQIRLGFYNNLLEPIGIVKVGTLLQNAMLEMLPGNDQLSLVFASSEPISGNDTLLMIRFRVKPNPSGYTPLTILNVRLNESIQLAASEGSFSVRQPSWRSINPGQASLIVGEKLPFHLEGQGIPPYTWKTSNPALASISSEGVMTALHRGSVTVTATDSVGISVSTDPLIIKDTRIQLPDTAICYYTGMIRYPIRMDALPRYESVLSLQSSFRYDTFYVDLDRLELAETIPSDWSMSTNEEAEGITFAASGSSPLTQSGNLLYVWFRLKPTFHSGAWSNIQLGPWLFNEGNPTTITDNWGNIQGKSKHPGYSSISCENQYWACLHDTIRFHAQIWDAAPVKYQWLLNRKPILGATGPDLFTTALNHLDTVSCKIVSLDPCIEDSVLMTNAIPVFLKLPPARPDSLTGDTVVYKSSLTEFDVHLQNWDVHYVWTLPKGFELSSGESTIYVNVTDSAQSGYVSVYTWNDCGRSEAVRLYVRVKTKPVLPDSLRILGPEVVCAGERNLVYRIPPIPHVDSYHWMLPDGFVGTSNADSIRVQVLDTAKSGNLSVYMVFETDTTFLASTYLEVSSKPGKAGPILGPTTIKQPTDSVVYMVKQLANAHFYHWQLPHGLYGWSETNTITVYPTDSTFTGMIYVQAFSWCGPGLSDSLSVSVTKLVGLDEPQRQEVLLHPNPFMDVLNLTYGRDCVRPNLLEIYDATGRLLHLTSVETGNRQSLDFTGKPAGIYLVKLMYENGYRLFKVVKK